MVSRPEINVEELERIAREFGVRVEVKKVSAAYFTSGIISWSLPRYNKIVVRIIESACMRLRFA